MPKYTVPVRFTGKIEYEIDADSPEKAVETAEMLAGEETRLGALEDIDFEAKPPVSVQN